MMKYYAAVFSEKYLMSWENTDVIKRVSKKKVENCIYHLAPSRCKIHVSICLGEYGYLEEKKSRLVLVNLYPVDDIWGDFPCPFIVLTQ